MCEIRFTCFPSQTHVSFDGKTVSLPGHVHTGLVLAMVRKLKESAQ